LTGLKPNGQIGDEIMPRLAELDHVTHLNLSGSAH
jgi:hypothetical protein